MTVVAIISLTAAVIACAVADMTEP